MHSATAKPSAGTIERTRRNGPFDSDIGGDGGRSDQRHHRRPNGGDSHERSVARSRGELAL
jgi:hypothetical protein